MAFDYSSVSEKLNVPNPLKIENVFRIVNGFIFAVGGAALLLQLRSKAVNGVPVSVWFTILVSLLMLLVGVGFIARALSQLRFYFGRGRPANLYGIHESEVGEKTPSDLAKFAQETLRHQAITYREPSGPLQQLLFSLLPKLIYSAQDIRYFAEVNFKNAIYMLVLLVSMLFALAGGRVGASPQQWEQVTVYIGLVYFVGALWLLVKGNDGQRVFSVNELVLLICIAIIGPILLVFNAARLPNFDWLVPFPHVYIVFFVAFLAYAVTFVALLRQQREAPSTMVSMIQEAWNVNCSPKQIMEEFARDLQDRWPEKIPNRRYVQIDPEINLSQQSGEFRCEMMQETQPFPVKSERISFASALQHPQQQMVFLLSILGAVSLLLSALAFYSTGQVLLGQINAKQGNFSAYGLMFLALGIYATRAAHTLWLKFEFSSQIVWLEMSGQFTSARLDYGNLLHDTVKSSSTAVKIETMTVRLWVANLESIIFGKDSVRYLQAMSGDNDYAQSIMRRLKSFADNQASIFAPTSSVDAERHAQLAQMNLQTQAQLRGGDESKSAALLAATGRDPEN